MENKETSGNFATFYEHICVAISEAIMINGVAEVKVNDIVVGKASMQELPRDLIGRSALYNSLPSINKN